MTEKTRIVRRLAELMTTGTLVESEIVERIEPLVVGKNAKWLKPLTRRLVASLGGGRRTTR